MVIEDSGEETAKLFDNGKEFITTKNKEEMLDKIKYYLSHDEEREKITQAGYEKITTVFTSRNMWAYVLNKSGFFVSGDLDYYKYVRIMESR
jgi:spore maturation protein CgeB